MKLGKRKLKNITACCLATGIASVVAAVFAGLVLMFVGSNKKQGIDKEENKQSFETALKMEEVGSGILTGFSSLAAVSGVVGIAAHAADNSSNEDDNQNNNGNKRKKLKDYPEL